MQHAVLAGRLLHESCVHLYQHLSQSTLWFHNHLRQSASINGVTRSTHMAASPPAPQSHAVCLSKCLRNGILPMQGGRCSVRCLEREPCKIAPAPAPQPEDLIVSHAFVAKRKYQPAPAEAPTLAALAPAPLSSAVCSCSSNDQGVRPGTSITFQYAGEVLQALMCSSDILRALVPCTALKCRVLL